MNDREFRLLCGFFLSLMVVFGAVGNIISLLTWRNGRRCKKFAGATYFTALAFSDFLVLCTSGLKSAIELLFQMNLWHLHEVLCKLLHTTWHLFFLVSTWVIVSLTIERTIAVCQPLKSAARYNKRREMVVVCILTVVALLLQLPFTVGAKLLPVKPKSTDSMKNVSYNAGNMTEVLEEKCQADPSSFYFRYENEYHNWFIDLGLLFAAPIGILIICNMIILVTIKRRNTALLNLPLAIKKQNGGAMTARVVALCLTLGLSVGPYSVAALIPDVMSENKAVSTVFNDRLMMVLLLIWYVNNSASFILYSIFGREFRRDCAALFCKKYSGQLLKSSLTYMLTRLSNTVSKKYSHDGNNKIFNLSCYKLNDLNRHRNSSSSTVALTSMQSLDNVW